MTALIWDGKKVTGPQQMAASVSFVTIFPETIGWKQAHI